MREIVFKRSFGICEYCHLPELGQYDRFQVDHVIAKQHKGRDTLGNLAFDCPECNRKKGPNISGIYRAGQQRMKTPLFNPIRNLWGKHFAWSGPFLNGRTHIGIVTIQVLDMNSFAQILARGTLILNGHHFAS